jgi:hypothetical protein
MNPNEPHSFAELEHWLRHVAEVAGSPSLPIVEFDKRCASGHSVLIWLIGCESPHKETIEKAADMLWLHEEEAFRDLPPLAASLLILRIETAAGLMREFVTSEPAPFDYPDGAFQEAVHWLLVTWWQDGGIARASDTLFLHR